MQQQNPTTYALDELASLAGLPRRTVRYYIQLGLVDRPIGETRAAYYTASHLHQLLAIARYSNAGLSLERIGELLTQPALRPVAAPRAGSIAVRSHLTLADGVELVVEPGRAGLSSEQLRRLYDEAARLYLTIAGENDDAR